MSKLTKMLKTNTDNIIDLENTVDEQKKDFMILEKSYEEEKKRTITVKDFTTKVLLKELLKREVAESKITSKDITDAKTKKRHPVTKFYVAPGRTIKNIDPDSVMRYLPTIGLRPIKTTDFLVAEGYLTLVKKDYDKVSTIKVPTREILPLFEARHNNGLYVTEYGKKVIKAWIDVNYFPKDCLIKG